MNIQEYISSGVLELYAMGALSSDEMREVEQYLSQYPELRVELDEIQSTLEYIALSAAVEPRPALKRKILDSLVAAEPVKAPTEPSRNILPLYPQHAPESTPAPVATVPSSSGWRRYMLAASVVFALLGASLAGYFGYRLRETERELAQVTVERDQVAEEFHELKSRMNKVMADLGKLENPRNVVIPLNGLEIAPEALAVVYWDPTTKLVYLTANQLPEPPQGHQYQLWALHNGHPIDAGLVANNQPIEALHHMKRIDSAQAFALTLEPEGGKPNPTGTMYVLGKL